MVVDKNYVNAMVNCLQRSKKVAGCDHLEFALNKEKLIPRLLYLRKVLTWKNKPLVARCVKKEILEKVKGIEPLYGYFDDQMLGVKIWKSGYKIVRCKKAKAWYREPETLKELWRQNKWIGKSIIFIMKKKDLRRGLRKSLFPPLCCFFPIYILSLFLPSVFKILGSVGLLTFLTIETYRTVKMYKVKKWKTAFLTPLFDILTMSLVFLGMLIGFLKGEEPKV